MYVCMYVCMVFSAYQHIWNKKSNSLSFDKANKIVYCYYNLCALRQMKVGDGPKGTVPTKWLEDEIMSDDEGELIADDDDGN